MGFSVRRAPLVAARSTATKAPEVADFAIEERGPKESLEYRIHFSQNGAVARGRAAHVGWASFAPGGEQVGQGAPEIRSARGALRGARGCEAPTLESLSIHLLLYRGGTPKRTGKPISCWHEIPLHAGDGLLHFVCEIPKETSAKMEVATDEPATPIKQDTKKGKLRFYPYNINWNYGLLPQTWEDPAHKAADLGGVAVRWAGTRREGGSVREGGRAAGRERWAREGRGGARRQSVGPR